MRKRIKTQRGCEKSANNAVKKGWNMFAKGTWQVYEEKVHGRVGDDREREGEGERQREGRKEIIKSWS